MKKTLLTASFFTISFSTFANAAEINNTKSNIAPVSKPKIVHISLNSMPHDGDAGQKLCGQQNLFKFQTAKKADKDAKILAILSVENEKCDANAAAKPAKNKVINKPAENVAKASEPVYEKSRPENNYADNNIKKDVSQESRGTQGHYLGFDLIGNDVRYYEEYTKVKFATGVRIAGVIKPSSSGTGVGAGLNYKYAFNFNDFFIAPGVFVEKVQTRGPGTEEAYSNIISAQNNQLDINYRYGIVANIGYDINSIFAPYAVIGYSLVSYRAENGVTRSDLKRGESNIKKSTTGGGIFGGGLKVNYNKHIAFNIEANTQSILAKTDANVPINNVHYVGNFRARINTVKLGVLYNF